MYFTAPTARLFLFLLLCFAPAILAQSKGLTIESIDIQGNRRLTDDEISKMISTRVGQTLDDDQLQKDLIAILSSGHFDAADTRVRTEPGPTGQAVVIFEVRELPLIHSLDLAGLKYVSREELEDYLSTQKPVIKAGMPRNYGDLRRYRELIRTYLARRGFEHATVTFAENEVSATSLSIIVHIDEMPGDDDNQ